MNITHNADNKPDLLGYEMKNQTSSGKITFGDWSSGMYYGNSKNYSQWRASTAYWDSLIVESY